MLEPGELENPILRFSNAADLLKEAARHLELAGPLVYEPGGAGGDMVRCYAKECRRLARLYEDKAVAAEERQEVTG